MYDKKLFIPLPWCSLFGTSRNSIESNNDSNELNHFGNLKKTHRFDIFIFLIIKSVFFEETVCRFFGLWHCYLITKFLASILRFWFWNIKKMITSNHLEPVFQFHWKRSMNQNVRIDFHPNDLKILGNSFKCENGFDTIALQLFRKIQFVEFFVLIFQNKSCKWSLSKCSEFWWNFH